MGRGGGPRTWWAPSRLCSASLRGATSPRAGAEVRRWARAPAEPPGAECAGGAALARNPHFHGDLGIGVPFFFFLSRPLLFFFSLSFSFTFSFSRIVRIVFLMHARPPSPGDTSSAVTAPRVLRGGSHARPPRPRGGGGDLPPRVGPPLSPPCLVQGQMCDSQRLAEREGRGSPSEKQREKGKKKKVDLPEGLGGKSLLWGLPRRRDYFPPSNAAGGERRARTTGGLPAAAPGLVSALSSHSGRKSALHFRELLKEIQAAGAITAHFNY